MAIFIPTPNTIWIENSTITIVLASFCIEDIYCPTAKNLGSDGRNWNFHKESDYFVLTDS